MNDRLLIAFAGDAGCGKDTAGEYLRNHLGFKLDKFALPIYEGLASILGIGTTDIAENKDNAVVGFNKTYRNLLQTLGTEWGRELVDPEIWVKLLEQRVTKYKLDTVITDVRFDNEASAVLRLGGIVVKIVRPDNEKIAESSHISEAGVSSELITGTIINSESVTDLYMKVDKLVSSINNSGNGAFSK